MPQFRRTKLVIDSFSPPRALRPQIQVIEDKTVDVNTSRSDASVLVINASHEMAKEITLQLTLKMPGCSITYAPTVELAQWILRRKKIDLVVSSPILPDGSVMRLKSSLHELSEPPDLVVIGEINLKSAEAISQIGYDNLSIRTINPLPAKVQRPIIHKRKVDDSVKSLGADLRNDLNNPLQEIVAMVFVAKASGQSDAVEQALEAIDKAAKNMATVVSGLEDKIRGAVTPLAL